MLDYIKAKSTLYALVSDMILLGGVFFLHWSAQRAIAFIFLDIEIMIFFFFIFLKLEDEITDYLSLLMAFSLFSVFVLVDFYSLNGLKELFNNVEPKYRFKDIPELLFPYYDVGFFVVVAGFGYAHTVKDLVKVKETNSTEWFEIKSVIYRLISVPVIFLAGIYLSLMLESNVFFTSLVLFICVREAVEYWKFKTLRKLKIRAALL
jgi:hypothetical protein